MRASIVATACFLLMMSAGPADEPKDVDQAKKFLVTGTLKQMIGTFTSPAKPILGDTFELDLGKLPQDMLRLRRPSADPMGGISPYIPYSASLVIERVDLRSSRKQGSSLIRLSAIGESSKLVIQLQAAKFEAGNKVTIYLYSESYGRIVCMAEAEGELAVNEAKQ